MSSGILESTLKHLTEETCRTNAIFVILDEIIYESQKLKKKCQIGSGESINMMYSLLMTHYEVKPHARSIFKQMLNKIVKRGFLKKNQHIGSLKRLFLSKRNNNYAKSFNSIFLISKSFCALKKITKLRHTRLAFLKKVAHYNALLKHSISRQKFGFLSKDYLSILSGLGIARLGSIKSSQANLDHWGKYADREANDDSISEGPDFEYWGNGKVPLGKDSEECHNVDRDFKQKLAIDFYGHTLAMKMFLGLKIEMVDGRGARERLLKGFWRVKREIYLGRLFQALEMVPYLMSKGL